MALPLWNRFMCSSPENQNEKPYKYLMADFSMELKYETNRVVF